MIPGEDRYDLNLSYEFSDDEIRRALRVRPDDVKPRSRISFCKNVFLPLTTACRYTCTYCTYFDVPGEASLMSREEVHQGLERGRQAGCREALFTFGDKPDERYEAIHDELSRRGYDSILEFLYRACEWAMDYGLVPHSNPGDLTYDEMNRLREVNGSMGVMLETTADVDAHAGPRTKSPAQRLRTLEFAGQLKIPFTTGILVGIGEDWRDRARSLLAIRKLHREYGHIQEVIIQNVVPNQRSSFDGPSVPDLRRVVAMARTLLPEEVGVQSPPNLAPVEDLFDCGLDDLGGVSPVTDDYINPDYQWPQIERLEAMAREHGFELVERGPVYPRYLERPGWVTPAVERTQPTEEGVPVAG